MGENIHKPYTLHPEHREFLLTIPIVNDKDKQFNLKMDKGFCHQMASMHMKRCSTLFRREIKIKISLRFHFPPAQMSVIFKRQPLTIVDQDVVS